MKKSSLFLVVFALVFVLAACGGKTGQLSDAPSKGENIEYRLTVDSSPIYTNVEFNEVSGSGLPTSYEELQDYIRCYEKVNFVRYEILGQYTPEEAVAVTGESYYKDSTTLYRALITYDYLNQRELNYEINLAKAGTPSRQIENDPLYMIGQSYISPLNRLDESTFVGLPGLVFSVYNIQDIDIAYQIRFENIKLTDDKYPNLDMGVLRGEELVVTSTENNPVKYVQKSLVDELSAFIREDWKARGYVFEDFKGYENRQIITD